MRKTIKKTLAFLLTLVMLVNVFSVSAFADTETKEGKTGPLLLPKLRGSYSVQVNIDPEFNYNRRLYLVFRDATYDTSNQGYLHYDLNYAMQEIDYSSLQAGPYDSSQQTYSMVERPGDYTEGFSVYLATGPEGWTTDGSMTIDNVKNEQGQFFYDNSTIGNKTVSITSSGNVITINIGQVSSTSIPHTVILSGIEEAINDYRIVAKVGDIPYYGIIGSGGTVIFYNGEGTPTEDGNLPGPADNGFPKLVQYYNGESISVLCGKDGEPSITHDNKQYVITLTGPDNTTHQYTFTATEIVTCEASFTYNSTAVALPATDSNYYVIAINKISNEAYAYAQLTSTTQALVFYGSTNNPIGIDNNSSFVVIKTSSSYPFNGSGLSNFSLSDYQDGTTIAPASGKKIGDIQFVWDAEPTIPDGGSTPVYSFSAAEITNSVNVTISQIDTGTIALTDSYYLVVGWNDGPDSYKYETLNNTNILGNHGFDITLPEGKNWSNLFVMIKRYPSGNTSDPRDNSTGTLVSTDPSKVGYQVSNPNTITDGGSEYTFTYSGPTEENDVHNYTITVQKTELPHHDVTVNVSSGVTFSENTYVVFMQKNNGSQEYSYWYRKIDGTWSTDSITHFTQISQHTQHQFDSDKDLQVYVVQRKPNGNDMTDNNEWLFYINNGVFRFTSEMNAAQNNGTIDGQNVRISTNSTKTATTITIGGEPTYTASFAFVASDGTTSTESRPDGNYYVIATKDGDASVKYKATVTDGTLDFGLQEGEDLPRIGSFQVYRYDSGNSSSSIDDIETGTRINDGDEIGGNTALFTIAYPNMEPEDRNYSFTATKIDTYTGASIQFFSDAACTTQESNPDTASNYYLVAFDGNTPVAYAAINGNGALNFIADEAVTLRSTYTYQLKQYPRVPARSIEELNTIAVAENTVSALNNYDVNTVPEVITNGTDQSLLFKASALPLFPSSFEKKGTKEYNPDGYYILAYRDGMAVAYAPVPNNSQNNDFSQNLDFTDGQGNNNIQFPEGTTFELVDARNLTTVSFDTIKDLPPVTPQIGDYTIVLPSAPTTLYGNTLFRFSATTTNPMNKIHLKIKNTDGEVFTPNPEITEHYYIRVTIQKYDDGAQTGRQPGWYDYGWALLDAGTPSTGETVIPFNSPNSLKFVPLDKKYDLNNLNDPNIAITYNSDIHRVNLDDKQAVRLMTIPNPQNLNRFDQCVAGKDGIKDDPPTGYSFEDPGVQEETYGTSINLIKDKSKNYQVKVRVEGASSVDDVPSI